MAEDLAVRFAKVKDDSEYQYDGTLLKQRVYVFYIGKHGPFTEKIPLANFDPRAIDQRVADLRLQLATLPA